MAGLRMLYRLNFGQLSRLGSIYGEVEQDEVVLCFSVSVLARTWWNIAQKGITALEFGVLFSKDDVAGIEAFKAKHRKLFYNFKEYRAGETLPYCQYMYPNAFEAVMKIRGVRV
jgi:hypothetical protein